MILEPITLPNDVTYEKVELKSGLVEFQFTHTELGPIGYFLIRTVNEETESSAHLLGDTIEQQAKNRAVFEPIMHELIKKIDGHYEDAG